MSDMVHGGEGVCKTRAWDNEPSSSVTNTIYPALPQPCEVGPKNLKQFLISHQWDL